MIWQVRALQTPAPICFLTIAVGLAVLLAAGLPSEKSMAQTQSPCPAGTPVAVNVMTYHNDSQRTGWNKQETALKPCNVDPRWFGLVASKRLDGQVDGQPLVLANQEVESTDGTRKKFPVVVYVATESNSVYAIDGLTGDILRQQPLGTPVGESRLPGGCGNNAPTVGISSTPVIDPDTRTIYLIAYLLEVDKPVYRIFALDPSDLSVKIKPAPVVAASKDLANGSKYEFNPAVSRQRAGLLLANKNLYAGFASYCDFSADVTRGWVLGWRAADLTPLPNTSSTDLRLRDLRLETNSLHDPVLKASFFLGSIWMSGYGIAVDDAGSGDIYFITGNSDPEGPFKVDPDVNLQESVVRMRADLSAVVDYFTPSDPQHGLQKLEGRDLDFGAGGALVVPGEQAGSVKHLMIAAGKAGQMYLLDRDKMGKFDPSGTNHVLDTVDIGKCWCGQSYFVGSDNVGRVVSSGDPRLKVWKVATSGSPKFALDYSPAVDVSAGSFQKGLFTSISSDDRTAGSAIIWAVRRPTDQTTSALTLYAFDAADGKLLYSGPAGSWRWYMQAAANVVPTVANGRVYVASNEELRIFGPTNQQASAALQAKLNTEIAGKLSAEVAGQLNKELVTNPANKTFAGSIIRVEGTQLWLNTRQGVVQVDTTKAREAKAAVHLEPGEPVTVHGSLVGNVVEATSIHYGLSTR